MSRGISTVPSINQSVEELEQSVLQVMCTRMAQLGWDGALTSEVERL